MYMYVCVSVYMCVCRVRVCVCVHVHCVYNLTCLVYWCVLCFIGLNIKKVAHDYATSVTTSSVSYSFSIPTTIGMV